MVATVHVLRPQSLPLAGFLRVGRSGYRKLIDTHAAGRFPFNRVVFDAAHVEQQLDLLKNLKSSGCEIVLDPNFAEMATARFSSSSLQKLAWSNMDRPWLPSDFVSRRNHDVAKSIAEFAVRIGVNVILAPTHLLDDGASSWISTDLNLCSALRHELDRAGGSDIAIDYQVIATVSALKEKEYLSSIALEIASAPIDNIWLRASGFGATATGARTRDFIGVARGFHDLNRPLVVDMAGGFAALGALAFGAVAGISHGVGQKEQFDASAWKKTPSGGGGAPSRTYVPELDRYFVEDQLKEIFNTKGGKSRFCCNDTKCCRHGSEDMIENSHEHFIIQRHRQIDDLSNVPDTRRAEHFLLKHLDPALRSARHAMQLKINDEVVKEAVSKAKGRLVRLRDALADLHDKNESQTRSRSVGFRGGAKTVSAVLGR